MFKFIGDILKGILISVGTFLVIGFIVYLLIRKYVPIF